MAFSPSSLLLPLGGSTSCRSLYLTSQGILYDNVRCPVVECPNSDVKLKSSRTRERMSTFNTISRRDLLGLAFGVSSIFMNSFDAKGAGLPPEQKPRLCDDTCEKELENVPVVTTESGLQFKDIKVGQGPNPPVGFQVAANYVAMVPSGQIFDR